jgi:hypothetical protein
MKKSFTLIIILFVALHVFAQTAVTIGSKEYQELKQQGKLTSNIVLKKPVAASNFKKQEYPILNKMPMPASSGCSTFIPGGTVVPGTAGIDDASSSEIFLPFTFCFYGTNYTSCYINNNGNISFDASYSTFSSSSFPSSLYTMIAPFWADVDNRGSGNVLYTLTPTALIVTWENVGYYNQQTDKLNTFQLIITDGLDPILPTGNNIGFNYGDMQWSTGDASGGANGFGGTPATVGINKGDGTSYIQLGRFDQPGVAYDGGYGNNDGVNWLSNKSFNFNACSGANIAPISGSLNNCDTIRICGSGDTLILNGLFLAPEIGQNTTISVALNGTPNASVINLSNGNSASAQVRIIATVANAGNNNITFTATDNGTPMGTTVVNVNVFVDTTGLASFNPVITGNLRFCAGDSTTLSVTPTTYDSYVWNTGSTTTSTLAKTSGLYYVTSTKNGCSKTNSVQVNINQLPTPAISPVSYVCSSSTATLTVDSLIYTSYQWSNGNSSSSVNVPAGSYSVTVTDANGCAQTSAPLTVTPLVTPQILAVSNDTAINAGGTVNLNTYFAANVVPPVCGLSTTGGCAGASSIGIIGTGTTSNTSTSSPAPYGNWYKSSVQQYLYKASELTAAGITGGKIEQLDFNITQINGITTYHEYTIKMGCTNMTTFNSATPVFASGLVTVFPAQTKNITVGWNSHTFATAFEWDGVSNIIVQICFNEISASSFTSNSLTTTSPTTYFSSIWSNYDSSDQCTSPTAFSFGTKKERPNIRLHYCSGGPNPSTFFYHWTPASGNIANANVQNTTAQPTCGNIDYIVTVTNPAGGCFDMDTVHVIVNNGINPIIDYVAPMCTGTPPMALHDLVPGGIWTGVGITDTINGIFNPAIAGAGNHIITYKITTPCAAMDTVLIIVVQQTNATVSPITLTGEICKAAAPVMLVAVDSGGTWSGAGVTFITSTSSIFNPASITAGNYYIKYSIPGFCGDIDSTLITVVDTTAIDFSVDTSQGCAPLTINFSSTAPVGGTCLWKFGDNNSSTNCNNPVTHTYTPSGSSSNDILYNVISVRLN